MRLEDIRVTDTERLEWLAENSAAIRKVAHKSPDPYYFLIYSNGETSASNTDFRKAIDCAISQTELKPHNANLTGRSEA